LKAESRKWKAGPAASNSSKKQGKAPPKRLAIPRPLPLAHNPQPLSKNNAKAPPVTGGALLILLYP